MGKFLSNVLQYNPPQNNFLHRTSALSVNPRSNVGGMSHVMSRPTVMAISVNAVGPDRTSGSDGSKRVLFKDERLHYLKMSPGEVPFAMLFLYKLKRSVAE